MKKLFVTLVIAAITLVGTFAQEASTVVLLNYSAIKKKVEKSDADIQDPKKNIKAATWEKRGELYQVHRKHFGNITPILVWKAPLISRWEP